MQELSLKYGCNPNQKPARIYAEGELPITILKPADCRRPLHLSTLAQPEPP